MINAYYVPIEEIQKVKWRGDAKTFDLDLYELGQGHDEFLIVNTDFADHQFYKNISRLPLINSKRCVVWKYNGVWIAKYFNKDWITEQKYWEVDLSLEWKINPEINIKFDIPIITDLYDLNYEMTWYLDLKFSNGDKIWIAKCQLQHCDSLGEKDMGYITPDIHLRTIHNPDIPAIDYDKDFNILWNDFKYECIWYLDPKYVPGKDKVWAVKVKTRGGGDKPVKDMGYASPKIIFNPDLPNLEYIIDDHIPYYDLAYDQVWMINDSITNNVKNVWAAKITPLNSKGIKVVGKIKINLPTHLDVIFISYNELNAEKNWERVKEKAPYAMRINGIKGIVDAHKCAAELATTDMFYVVDGDSYLIDDFNFNFQPDIFNRDCVHVWQSINPINDLVYGYGGVKLLPKELTLQVNENNADMTTSISNKFKLMKKVSNITEFNTDAFNTFRSAFRECAKLSSGILKRQLNRESKQRLEAWCNTGADRPWGEYAIKGACAGRKFGEENSNDITSLLKINDAKFILNIYKKLL